MKIAQPIGGQDLSTAYFVGTGYDFAGNNATDITSVSAFLTMWSDGYMEYGVFRTTLKALVGTSVSGSLWTSMSFSDKQICITHFCYPPDIGTTEYGTYVTVGTGATLLTAQDFINWGNLVNNCMDSNPVGERGRRLRAAVIYFTYVLTAAQALPISLVVFTLMLHFVELNTSELSSWLNSVIDPETGTNYTTNGFASYTNGYSSTILSNINNILSNGSYTFKGVNYQGYLS